MKKKKSFYFSDTADALKSDSIFSKNTSILKSLSFVEPSSTVSTFTSFSQKNTDEDNLKELIDKVTRQDVILSIINKCIEDTGTALNANLKCKIKKILKFNSFKASYEENNLNEILVLNDGGIDLNSQNDEMKLTDKEAQELNKVIQKFIDIIHTQIVLGKQKNNTQWSQGHQLNSTYLLKTFLKLLLFQVGIYLHNYMSLFIFYTMVNQWYTYYNIHI